MLLRNIIFCSLLVSSFTCLSQENLELAINAYEDEKYMLAISTAEEVLADNPKSFEAWFVQGNAHQKLEDYQGAIAAYKQALKLNSESAELYTNLGVAYFNAGDLDMAYKYVKKALKLADDHAPAYYHLGNFEYSEFRNKSALKAYNQAIVLDNVYRDALYMRSAVYYELGDYKKALMDIEHVLEIDPNLQQALMNKAIIYLAVEQYDNAVDILKEINPQMTPNAIDYYYYLGEAQYFSGSKDEACQSYTEASERGDEEAAEIYEKYCLTGAERKARKQKRTISMSF